MQNLLNPKWLFVLNTLPLVVLALLLGAEYGVIHTLLPPDSKKLWLVLGSLLVGLGVVHAGYAGWQLKRKQPLPALYGALTLAAYIAFLYLYGYHLDHLFPREVPRWMVPGEMPLYAGTFLMPTLAHAALVILLNLTPADQPHRALPNFGVALAVPVGAYLFGQLVLPWWRVPGGQFGQHALVVLFITGTLVFLFFLARGVYILLTRKAGVWAEYQLLWKVLITLVMPVLGLLVNSGVLFRDLGAPASGIFGNFHGWWFYGLAVLNGALLCVPAPTDKWWRLALLAGRSFTLAYTLYFFLVFLPFLPLSVVAVVAVGVGFLMLTPLLLLLVHLRELSQDVEVLRTYFSRRLVIGVLIASSLLLPLGITANYLYCRQALHQALAYIYTPDYSKPTPQINANPLLYTLERVRAHKDPSASVFGSELPYLSTYFNWLVLDNLTLSEEKLQRLEQVFGSERPVYNREQFQREEPEEESRPQLTKLTSRSHYDARQAAWSSWVDLEITNPDQWGNAEYHTTLALPLGCWVQEYYLDMHGRREKGILAEKKSAMWVFAQIRNEQRDPGILYYLTGNRLALRVFPFAAREVRRTGFRVLHKEPVALQIAGQTVQLGEVAASATQPLRQSVTTSGGQVVYLSATAKQALPLVQRRPYYHFLLDASATASAKPTVYQQRIESFLQQRPGAKATARYSLVNSEITTLPAGTDWLSAWQATPATGGYYLEGAMQRLLAEAWLHPTPEYPVLVTVTGSLEWAVLPANFAALQAATPEQSTFLVLAADGSAQAHSLLQHSSQPLLPTETPAEGRAVRAWPTAEQPRAYLPDNEQPSVVLGAETFYLPPALGQTWQDGLWLQGYQLYQARNPAAAEPMRLAAIRGSFRSGILSPLTSYLALENEAQKAALLRKQNEVLAGNAALDVDDDVQRMSEPELWVLLLAVGIWGLRNWYRHQKGVALAK
ncbi:hypothetical protein HNQ93_001646 [Hymenobacter luteus]|uniref:MSEP-CTERM sorting domain-containing protein n=2 Tax=Hymenobacter TaxID=89966 RepID=A0A7W9T0N2_9BACT|nr:MULTISPECIES: MSEP-CTERM sorting domain-containing protein [Hymenobacter]MBB4600993.1 hypothetical protein [Hymenobacter latericoloratus]MBB6058800.1 hypothetical protein [Hymenobacter luteus]